MGAGRGRVRAGWGILGLTLSVAAGVATMPTAASAAALKPVRCSQTSVLDTSRCADLPVPLDRSGAIPGTVSLRVRTLDPEKGAPTGTILVLAGGPGQAAAPLLPQLELRLLPMLKHRRLVAFDQRGTGASGPLRCPKALSRRGTRAQIVAACAQELGPRRTAYTTAASVADIEDVRAAIGVDRLILYGTSYGTKVALAYGAAHPEHVERVVLDSTVGPDGVDPLGRATAQAGPGMLADLCRGGGCPFTSDPAALLQRVVARAGRTPIAGRLVLPTGRTIRARVTQQVILANLVAGDLSPTFRAGLPAALESLDHGDAAPLLGLGGNGSAQTTAVAGTGALYLATSCEDAAGAWPAGTPVADRPAAVKALVASLPAGTWGPFAPAAAIDVAGSADLCASWPESPIEQPPFVAPTAPTLIVSGTQDQRTPPANAAALAAAIPGAQVLSVPDTGHSVITSATGHCARVAMAAFLDGATVTPCPARARSVLPIAAVAPRSMAAVGRVRGLPTGVGRTWRALRLTVDDLALRLSWASSTANGDSAVGGLRGGRAVTSFTGRFAGGIQLQRYSFVPGMAISGRAVVNPTVLDLRLGGRAARPGRARLDLRHHRLTATIDGHRLRARVDTSVLRREL
jgi:pimeloyl-ACP methyl ester carboxylesterase